LKVHFYIATSQTVFTRDICRVREVLTLLIYDFISRKLAHCVLTPFLVFLYAFLFSSYKSVMWRTGKLTDGRTRRVTRLASI